MNVWDYRGEVEFATPADIREVQTRLLRQHLAYLMTHSPYYRSSFAPLGIDSEQVTLDTLASLPLTDKSVLSEDPDAFLAVSRQDVSDIVLSSGTTGRSTTVMYTENDLRRLTYNEEISFAGCGITSEDTVLLTCTLDRCFVAGLAYYHGARSIGAAVIRNGLCSIGSHIEIIRRLKPTVIVGVPTFLLKLGEALVAGADRSAVEGVHRLICIGEPIRDRDLSLLRVGERLEECWGANCYSTYASSETISSFCECAARQGGHLHPELAIVEIIDEDGTPLSPGSVGEVVTTPLAIEGMPLLRFKTGDISFLIDEPCDCGRNSLRLGPILGRKAQMIKYRGTTLYPNAIYVAMDSIPGIDEFCVIVTSDFDLADIVAVYVSVRDEGCTANVIGEILQAYLRVLPRVTILSTDEMIKRIYPSHSRKPVRFFDERRKP